MTRWKNPESGRGAQLKVLQRMPRIHSWQEVIAPRDCWCIPPCAPPRAPPPVPPAASNPHRVPLGSHRPLHPPPPGGTSNEQFHYCLTPVINLHGRPLALPPPAPILHPLLCRGSLPCFTSSPPKTPPSLAQLRISSLAFSGSISLHYVSSLLSFVSSLYLFPPILGFFHRIGV